MKVLLNALKSAPEGTKKYQREVHPPQDLKNSVQPAKVDFTATYTGNGILITGQLETTYDTNCDRCLKPAKKEISINFQEEFRQMESSQLDQDEEDQEEEDDEKEVVLDSEDLNVDYFSGNELDLTDLFRQMLILAIPPKVVCQEDCPGLCPHCGVDLSSKKCQCKGMDIDPRMAKLQELKKDL
ncbi:YceD family protein [Natranaerobius thermophilus]|uniref:DUF177 domain-containing protein n=1 Tax=Natranaerobius thermophilus (strain ATCC BAA-1301 / DSM 18059 / JW/NM-WN-LF) TaxID=457570 RepID=B2A2M2_NATTJ|nr:DUF177 domain-containing protein [Natranaerobius thermophilus]ACB84937.1 protein of unknown function DUF177 [Natranaerobius thermophilus JW/NM-WN-LF]